MSLRRHILPYLLAGSVLCFARSTLGEVFEAVLEPAATLGLVLDVSGIVEAVSVSEGDAVAVGDELIRLESSVERLILKKAETRRELAEERLGHLMRKMDRYAGLKKQGLVSADQWGNLVLEVLNAREAFAIAEDDVEMARQSIARRSLKAPLDGVVFRVSCAPGEGVQPLEVLVDLMDVNHLRANFYLPQRFVGKFVPGQILQFRVQGPSGSVQVEGRVDRVDPFVDPATGVMRLSVLLASDVGSPGERLAIFLADTEGSGI